MRRKNTQVSNNKTIDLNFVIASKSKRLAQLMPGFIMNYLKRIVHEDELNEVFNKYKDVGGYEFVNYVFKEMEVNIKVINKHNIPSDGRYIFVANHPLGGLDGLAFISCVGNIRKEIIFPANDILMNVPNIKEFFIPINKHGSNAQNIALFNQTFESDKTILYFPAGLCSRKKKGEICDLEWKKTFVKKAKQYDRDIIPVFIDGKNSNFFYILANLRQKLKIKANIEMLYLVNEMFKQKNQTISLRFGTPIQSKKLDRTYRDNKWAEKIKQHVYNLENNPDLDFVY